jgi:uncharacterized protein (TIGR00288 family)
MSTSAHEPHAALLIDFDNVTMGIRSDLTKELKNLLNSDIIKGKVAVQRAYADWRRYPQYIVPLAESSVDLIFAPAYGSAKKNATDIRLAIDAVELVFTRPEIGTIILLSGDSDFSSLVLKLKEYGKYVIGVGIRESASDLLVQNCDEYYSYSALTGLTRAGDETAVISEDPWELVEMSLRQMIDNGDVMRSDRLKQVLLEMDPGFDEKTLGFAKFNKFLQEAAGRGIISLRKQENGQYEVGPPSAEATEAAAADARGEPREGRSRRGRRGRGRRDEPREERLPEIAAAEAADTGAAEPETAAAADAPAEAYIEPAAPAAAAAAAAMEPAAAEREVEPDPAVAGAAPAAAELERQPSVAAAGREDGELAASYDLLRRAVLDLTRKSGVPARDSDVKRRMLELRLGWDESSLGFSKFSRFLRQAHDASVVTLRRGENGNYDVLPGDGEMTAVEEPREARPGRRDRGRGRDRDRGERREYAAPLAAAPAPVTAGATQATTPAPAEQPPAAAVQQAQPAAQPAQPAAQAQPARPAAPAQPAAIGFRRGSRGRPGAAGPPPLLDGQTAPVAKPLGAAPARPAGALRPAPVEQQPEQGAEAGKQPEQAAQAGRQRTAAKAAKQPAQAAKQPAKAAKQPAKAAKQPAGAAKQPAKAAKQPAQAAKQPAPAAKQPTQAATQPAGAATQPAKAAKQPAKAAKQPAGAAKQPAGAAKQTAGAAKQPAGAAKQTARAAKQPARAGSASSGAGAAVDVAVLGLPREPDAVARYIASNYKGVGPKSVQALIDRFGGGGVFDALETRPDEVREIMGAARGDRLLSAWSQDLKARRTGAALTETGSAAPQAAATQAAPRSPEASAEGSARKSRGRRGGRRGRGGRPEDR